MLIKHTIFGGSRSVEKKVKGSQETAVLSSHQEYCVQFLVPLFKRDMDKLSREG